MKNMFVNVGLLLLVIGGRLVAQTDCGPRISPFIEGPAEERLHQISELHAKGKQALPLLIDEIDSREIAPVTLTNLFSSKMPISSPVYCGAVAAYLIELILGRPKLSLQVLPTNSSLMLGGGPDNYVYVSGCIVDINSQKPINPDLLRVIKDLYAAWWRSNEDRSLDDLRGDWRKGTRPLSGSGYQWR